jgi:hypothetical protein
MKEANVSRGGDSSDAEQRLIICPFDSRNLHKNSLTEKIGFVIRKIIPHRGTCFFTPKGTVAFRD